MNKELMRNLKRCRQVPGFRLIADLSTGHIEKSDADLLAAGPVTGLIGKFEYGWFVQTKYGATAESRERLKASGFSDSYVRLMKTLIDMDVYYLCLDRDGPYVDRLRKFNW